MRGVPAAPPAEAGVPEDAIRLLSGLFLTPNTRGGLFLPGCVETERTRLRQRIEAQDGHDRMRQRLLERMCPGEAYAVPRLGTGEQAASIHYVRLSKDYRSLLAAAPLELFLLRRGLPAPCGGRPNGRALSPVQGRAGSGAGHRRAPVSPRGRSPVLRRAVRGRSLRSGAGVPPGPLDGAGQPGGPGGVLCPVAAALPRRRGRVPYTDVWEYADIYKGVFLLFARTVPENRQAAQESLMAVWESFCREGISPEELEQARHTVFLRLRGREDDPRMLEEFWLGQALMGLEYGPGKRRSWPRA